MMWSARRVLGPRLLQEVWISDNRAVVGAQPEFGQDNRVPLDQLARARIAHECLAEGVIELVKAALG